MNIRLQMRFLRLAIISISLMTTLRTSTGLDNPYKTEFFTESDLTNKVFSRDSDRFVTDNEVECRRTCEKAGEECYAYAISAFAKLCKLYPYVKGAMPVFNPLYTLYITRRSKEQGFFMYRDTYIKIFHHPMNIQNAQKQCEEYTKGTLIGIRDEDTNDFVTKLMKDVEMYHAFIGLTDQKQERNWTYIQDGFPATYFNWHYKGEWYRRDMNCVEIMASGKWRHVSCYNTRPFICQLPFY